MTFTVHTALQLHPLPLRQSFLLYPLSSPPFTSLDELISPANCTSALLSLYNYYINTVITFAFVRAVPSPYRARARVIPNCPGEAGGNLSVIGDIITQFIIICSSWGEGGATIWYFQDEHPRLASRSLYQRTSATSLGKVTRQEAYVDKSTISSDRHPYPNSADLFQTRPVYHRAGS